MADQRDRWSIVDTLFHDALALPASERQAFVQAGAGADSSLVDEVTALLAAHDGTHVLLDAPAPSALPTGTRLGAYALDRIIGSGGMATVYLAHRADRQFDKHVAIKLVHGGLASELTEDRFQIERRALARLEHPNIARLLDAGVNEFGQPYLVMEWVEGWTLDVWLTQARPTLERRLDLWLDVAGAVAFAHSHLVIHRDIKPSNVLVNADGRAKLVDFGVAKLIEGDDGTLTSGIGFTPRYASPEQLAGTPATTTTDTFGLGLLLGELVTGRHLFEGDGASRPGAYPRGSSEEPVLPPTLPSDLAGILRMAVRSEPARRYATVTAFVEDVRHFRRGEPVIAQPDSLAYRVRMAARRHRVALTVGCVAFVLATAALAAIVWQGRVAVAERDRATVEARKSEQINAFLQSMLREADPAREGRDVRVADVLDRAAMRLPQELAGLPEVEASLHATLAATYQGLGLFDKAVDHAKRGLALRERPDAPPSIELARSLIDLGDALHARGDYRDAEPVVRRGLTMLESLGLAESIDRANGLRYLGEILNENGDYQQAERLHRESIARYRRLIPTDDERVAGALNDLAVTLGNQQNFSAAEPVHREALAIMRRVYGSRHLLVAQTLNNLAGALDAQGRYAESERLYREALAIELDRLGENHSRVVLTKTSLANMFWMQQAYAKAEALGRSALDSAERSLPSGHPLTAYARMVLGQTLTDSGRPAEGEPHLRAALEARRVILPEGHWLVANTESVLGGSIALQGRFREAEQLLIASYERLRANRGQDNDKTIEARQRLARMYEARGDTKKAASYSSSGP